VRFMLPRIPEGYESAAPGAMPDAELIEIRRVQELSSLPSDVQEAAVGFSDLRVQSGERTRT